MEEKDIISIEVFCAHYQVPESFVTSLREFELIETVMSEGVEYIEVAHLSTVEKLVRLHYELNINMEGLDVVNNLLRRVTELQDEIHVLRNRLKLYE